MRIIAENQQIVRVDWDSDALMDEEYEKINILIKKQITNVDAMIISDYDKSLCKKGLIQCAIGIALKADIPVFVDPKGIEWTKYRGATIIKPNLKETENLLGRTLISNNDYENAGKEICDNYNIGACLITRGKDGMTFYNKVQTFHSASKALDVYDVSGAGDTVIACLAAALTSGINNRESIHFANKAAGIVVGHVGTSAITREELK